MDSVDAVQMALERYMLEFFEAARSFPSGGDPADPPPPEADPADRVLVAYRALESSILALEDADVARAEQERMMERLQAEHESVGREILSLESTLRSLEQSNDGRIQQLLLAARSGGAGGSTN